MAILNNNPLIGAGGNQGYNINNSLRFRSSASAYLSRTPASAGNRQIYTRSVWVKRGALTSSFELFSAGSGNIDTVRLTSSDNLLVRVNNSDSTSNRVFRDPSAWGHLVIVVDTTQATSTNRMKAYWNNELITWSTYAVPAQNTQTEWNNNVGQSIGTSQVLTNYFDGYMAEFYNIDGQALTPSSFGETDTTTGVWKPKAYTGTYGTNGFYLKFSDIATTSGSNAGLGKDFSGNSNYWTTNNISVTSGTTYDAMTDSPTNTSATVANYAVMNPLNSVTQATLADGNLNVSSTTAAWKTGISTIQLPTSGKWYFETTIGSGGVGNGVEIGLVSYDQATYRTYKSTGTKNSNTGGGVAYGASYTSSDIIGAAIDVDAGTIVFYKNNSSQGTAFSDIASAVPSSGWYLAIQANNSSNHAVNFGQRPFAYTPPTGFKALNTYNLPDSTIKKGNSYMDATLYTGNGGTQVIVNQAQFKPDFVWVKNRTTSPSAHRLVDSVRGATKEMYSNATDAETTDTNGITAFNSNGFSVGSTGGVNLNGNAIVGWQWQAGQGSTSSNTSGSITSTVSVNATAGFSIVTYTGLVGDNTNRTIGHGLGVAPSFIIVKNRNWAATDYAWMTWHTSGNKVMPLNQTAASTANDYTYYFGGTAPTSTVFTTRADTTVSTGNRYATQGRADSYVAYCWADVSGYSKAFSYTGNGSSDGPMVYLGLKPKFVMLKRTDTTGNWIIYDSSRNTYNVVDLRLIPNTTDAEATVTTLDFLSNGFKLRTSDVDRNANGGTYIGIAFAENPFKNSNAR